MKSPFAIVVLLALAGCAEPPQFRPSHAYRYIPPAYLVEFPTYDAPHWPVRQFEYSHHRGRYQAGGRFYRQSHTRRK